MFYATLSSRSSVLDRITFLASNSVTSLAGCVWNRSKYYVSPTWFDILAEDAGLANFEFAHLQDTNRLR
jgi:hypothetical protein